MEREVQVLRRDMGRLFERPRPVVRVGAYCRVSTELEAQQSSLDLQIMTFKAQIALHAGWVLADIYADDGVSGTLASRRTEFQRMIRDCEAGKIDLILSKSISRFARNLPDCIRTIRRLCALGVGVYFEREGLDTLAPNMELLLNCLAAIAEEESTSIGQNLRWAQERQNAAGKPCRMAAYGYRKDENRDWIVCPDEARRVALAFGMANRGESYAAIRAALNALEAEEATGRAWDQTTLGSLLRNEAYCGDILTNKHYSVAERGMRKNRGERQQFYIEGHHAALVPRAVFERVNDLMDRRLLWKGRKLTADERRLLDAALPMDMKGAT